MGGRPGGARVERNVLARAVADTLAFDRSALAIWPGLRAALGVVGMLSVGLGFSSRPAAAAMAAGALLAGNSSISGGSRPPLGAMAGVTFAMALSTFVGAATGHVGWLHLGLLAPWAFGGSMLVALGPTASSLGLQAVMAMIVFGRFAQSPTGALELAGYVAAGGAAQIALAAVLRPPLTPGAQRRALAAAYRCLGELAAGGAHVDGHATGARMRPVSGIPAAELLDAAAAALETPLLMGRVDAGPLQSLLDVGRRLRLDLMAVHGLDEQLARQPGGPGPLAAVVVRTLADAREALVETAWTLEGEHPEPGASAGHFPSASTLQRALPGPGLPGAIGGHAVATSVPDAVAGALVDRLAALGGQLRAAAALAERAADVRALPALSSAAFDPLLHPLAGARAAAELLRANLSLGSPGLRHALRMAVVLPLAEVIAEHTPLQRGYWIALTAAVVLRPDFSSTFARGVARVLGTFVGVGVAGLLAVGLHPSGAAVVAVVGLCTWAASALLWVNYAAFSALLTGLVVLLLSFVAPDTLATASDRLEATLLGGALALGAYACWPTWSREEAGAAIGALVEAQRVYLREVLGCATGRAALDAGRLRAFARHARLARTHAEAAVARSLADPARRRIDASAATGALSALRRIALCAHGLRLGLEPGAALASGPAAASLATAFEAALELSAAAAASRLSGPVGTGELGEGPGRALPRLRLLHDRLLDESLAGPSSPTFLAATDELVDAIDTLADVLGAAGKNGAPNGRAPKGGDCTS